MKLGKIKFVDLREVWPNEAQSFTPWLEANPSELGDLLGMDLEFVREKSVGKFSLDLFGTDLQTGRKLVVENQLEPSNHSHLGQLLTYAGGIEPSIIVWVAKSIREEHRAALEWLNSVTNSETMFFGVEVKAIRIEDSVPAPWLDIVVEPNTWSKVVKENNSGFESEREKAYSQFWQSFIDAYQTEFPELASRLAWGRTWFPTGAGVSGVNLNLVFTPQGLRVEIYFGSSDAELNASRFNLALGKKEEIEALAGKELSWDPLEGKKASRISLLGPACSISASTEWESYRKWFAEAYALMKTINSNAIQPIVKK